ncbi:MAG TPA: hypothetical protein ENJ28_03870, partial [Gammaproteobacteria bacterium]|nr:hypothetical protein [Gammaproteobacteria bacterium]
MRILSIVSGIPPYHQGGNNVLASLILDALAKLGHDVNVLVVNSQCVRMENEKRGSLNIFKVSEKEKPCLEEKYDLIVLFEALPHNKIKKLKLFKYSKLIYFWLFSFERYRRLFKITFDIEKYLDWERNVISLSDLIIFPTEDEMKWNIENHTSSICEKECFVLPHPILPFKKVITNNSLSSKIKVGIPGRIDDPMKGANTVLSAIYELHENARSKFHFYFIGSKDGRLHIPDSLKGITVIPWFSDLNDFESFIQNMDLVVCASRYEPFG